MIPSYTAVIESIYFKIILPQNYFEIIIMLTQIIKEKSFRVSFPQIKLLNKYNREKNISLIL